MHEYKKDFLRQPEFSEWRTVDKDTLERLIKIDSEVRRIVIKARAEISHIEQSYSAMRVSREITTRRTWTIKVKAFDDIGKILERAGESDG